VNSASRKKQVTNRQTWRCERCGRPLGVLREGRLHEAKHEATTNRELSPACARLLELCRYVNYGRIEGLRVLGGEPVLDGPVRVVRSIRTDTEATCGCRTNSDDFTLKKQHIAFFAALAQIRDGTVKVIEVQDGLPLRMEVEETVEV